MAAAAARQQAVGKLYGFASRFREAWRGVRLHRNPVREARRSGQRHSGNDQREAAGDLRLPGGEPRQLLSDDPVGQGTSRNAARGRCSRRGDRASRECGRKGSGVVPWTQGQER